MENFTFRCATKTIFGRETEKQVGQEVKHFSSKILLHYGSEHIKRTGLYQTVVDSLNEAGVSFIELSGVVPNPRVSLVRKGIELCRKNGIDFILAVGGGSVIDSSKSISAGVPYDGDVWDFYIGKAKPQNLLPVGVVLTIPASGSEQSDSNVITNDDGQIKGAFGHPDMRPVFCILNPELTFTLPSFQTACGCMDIMAHTMERYFTNSKDNSFTDRLCEATLKTIIYNLPIALAEPENYDARSQIMWAGSIAHNDLVGTGRIGDWANHIIEHEISGLYDIAHGSGLAITFPAWMKYIYKHDLSRFTQFAVRVLEVEMNFENPKRTALEGIRRFEAILHEAGLKTSLSGVGIVDDRFEEMASRCTENGSNTVGQFVKLTKQDIINIFNIAR
jgi:alcohol dehydrogenase YqhD (iron-dependent ADH family)